MYYFWGMHWFWWFFWILLWVVFFSFMMPVRRITYRQMQSPLQLLQRRYAAGEITSEEYEERRAKLLRDANMKEGTQPGLNLPGAGCLILFAFSAERVGDHEPISLALIPD
jgi:putative membrane protein